MKNIKLLYFMLASMVLIFTACEPIVNEVNFVDTTDVAGVKLVATQTPPGGNKITLSMVSPGIIGYWDYGTIRKNEVSFLAPITGKSTFTYIGTLGTQFFKKTIEVQVDRIDTPLDQMYYDLVGTNLNTGKDWVFDKAVANNNGLWYFQSPVNDLTKALTVIYNNGLNDPPFDANGKMHFDLNGALNYDHYSTRTATPSKGSFILDIESKKITIKGGNPFTGGLIGGAENGSQDGVYDIISLSATKMVLYDKLNENQNGFTFVFKAL